MAQLPVQGWHPLSYYRNQVLADCLYTEACSLVAQQLVIQSRLVTLVPIELRTFDAELWTCYC